jgi:hypothetical protein
MIIAGARYGESRVAKIAPAILAGTPIAADRGDAFRAARGGSGVMKIDGSMDASLAREMSPVTAGTDTLFRRRSTLSLGTILLIIVILLLIGALPTWPYSSGWGYYPSGGIGLVLVIIIIILLLMGRL